MSCGSKSIGAIEINLYVGETDYTKEEDRCTINNCVVSQLLLVNKWSSSSSWIFIDPRLAHLGEEVEEERIKRLMKAVAKSPLIVRRWLQRRIEIYQFVATNVLVCALLVMILQQCILFYLFWVSRLYFKLYLTFLIPFQLAILPLVPKTPFARMCLQTLSVVAKRDTKRWETSALVCNSSFALFVM